MDMEVVHCMTRKNINILDLKSTTIVCPNCGQVVESGLMYEEILVANEHYAPNGRRCPGSGALEKNKSEFLEKTKDVRRVLVRDIDELTDVVILFLRKMEKNKKLRDTMFILWDGRIVEPVFLRRVRYAYPIQMRRKGLWHREALKRELYGSLVENGESVTVLMEFGSQLDEAYLVKWHIKWQHPEQRPDEIFLGNYFPEMVKGIGWKTKRSGEIPFCRCGEVEEGQIPVFIQKKEMEETEGYCEVLARLIDP